MNAHDLLCECLTCQKEPDYYVGARWDARNKIRTDRLYKTKKIFDLLGISYHEQFNDVFVAGDQIVSILMDDEKLEEFISKLKNKAFW